MALFAVPRSPRWLIQKLNEVTLAKKILIKIGGDEFADTTIGEIQRGIAKKEAKGTYADFFSKRMRVIVIIAFGLAFFQQITGINAIFYYAPTIFEQAGGSTDASFLQAIVVGLTNLVFTFVAIYLIDKLGRKPLLIIGTSAMAIALSMATLAFNNATYNFNETTIEKISNPEIKTALTALNGLSFVSQNELFENVQPLLNEAQFTEFKQNEIKSFISDNDLRKIKPISKKKTETILKYIDRGKRATTTMVAIGTGLGVSDLAWSLNVLYMQNLVDRAYERTTPIIGNAGARSLRYVYFKKK